MVAEHWYTEGSPQLSDVEVSVPANGSLQSRPTGDSAGGTRQRPVEEKRNGNSG